MQAELSTYFWPYMVVYVMASTTEEKMKQKEEADLVSFLNRRSKCQRCPTHTFSSSAVC